MDNNSVWARVPVVHKVPCNGDLSHLFSNLVSFEGDMYDMSLLEDYHTLDDCAVSYCE